MKYEIIQTGSKGNCLIINENIMLDCGISYLKLKNKLNKIKIIFISHAHKDHLLPTTIKKIAYEKPNIKFLVGKYLVSKLLELGVNKGNIITFDLDKWYDIGIFKAKMQYVFHDVPNNCLHLEFKNGEKIFYAVDTSSIDHIEAKDYTYYFIEANYETDEEITQKIIEAKQNGKFTYLERVRETHLSQLQAINWLDKNKGVDSEYVFIHQHQDEKEIKK